MSDDRRRRFLKGAAVRGGDFNIPDGLLKKVVQQRGANRWEKAYSLPCVVSSHGGWAIGTRIFFHIVHGEEPTTGHSTAQATVQWPTRFWS